MTTLRDRITIDPGQMGGSPCVRHLRMPVYTILGALAEGRTPEQICADWPVLEIDDVRAACAYAMLRLESIGAWVSIDCVICGKETTFGMELPYGSAHDGEYVCDECVRATLDPIVDAALMANPKRSAYWFERADPLPDLTMRPSTAQDGRE